VRGKESRSRTNHESKEEQRRRLLRRQRSGRGRFIYTRTGQRGGEISNGFALQVCFSLGQPQRHRNTRHRMLFFFTKFQFERIVFFKKKNFFSLPAALHSTVVFIGRASYKCVAKVVPNSTKLTPQRLNTCQRSGPN
jgi:hypothetical protein